MAKKKSASGMAAFLLANLFTFDGTTVVRYHSVVLFLLLRLPQVMVLGYLVLQIVFNSSQMVQRFVGEVFLDNTLSFGNQFGVDVQGIADVGAGIPSRVNGTLTLANSGSEDGGWVDSIAEDRGTYLFLRTAFYEVREEFLEVDGVWAWRQDAAEPVVRSLMVQNISLFDDIKVQTVARMVCTLPEGTLRWHPFGSEAQTHVFSNFKDPSKWTDGEPPQSPYDHSLAYTTARELVLVALGARAGLTLAEEDELIEKEILSCYGNDPDPLAELAWTFETGDIRGPCLFTNGATLSLLTEFDCNFNLLENGSEDDGRYGCSVSRSLDSLSSSSTTQEVSFIYSSNSRANVRRKQYFGGIRVELRGGGTCSASTVDTVNSFVSALVSYLVLAYTAVFAISVYLLTPEAYAIQFSHYESPPTVPDTYFQKWYDKMEQVKHIVDFTRKGTTKEGDASQSMMQVLTDRGGEEEITPHRTFKSVIASNRLNLKGRASRRNLDASFDKEGTGDGEVVQEEEARRGGGKDGSGISQGEEDEEERDTDGTRDPPNRSRTWVGFFMGEPKRAAGPAEPGRYARDDQP